MTHSRARCCLIASLSVWLAIAAHAESPIEWSKAFKLSERDFRQKVPATATDSAHSWVGINVAWECGEGRPAPYARAVFDPDQSWWRGSAGNIWSGVDGALSRSQLENRRTPAERDADLLSHEQLHFDLTELAARKMRAQFTRLDRACASGRADAEIGPALAALERAWVDEQARYDRETDHGTNRPMQIQWQKRVQRELER